MRAHHGKLDWRGAAEHLPDADFSPRAVVLNTRGREDDEDEDSTTPSPPLQASAQGSPAVPLPDNMAVHAQRDVHIGQQVHVGYKYSSVNNNMAEQIVCCKNYICKNYASMAQASAMEDATSLGNIRDQTKAELLSIQRSFVETESYRQAVVTLAKHGVLLISGPPESGKSVIARSVLTHFENQGFIALILHSIAEWRQHVGRTRQTVVLLEHMFGDMFFDSPGFEQGARFFRCMDELAKLGSCLTVFTAYPHIAEEMRGYSIKDNPFRFVPVVSLHQHGLSNKEKREMIRKHRATMCSSEREALFTDIIARDISGCVFPGCLKVFMEALFNAEDISIFSKPALSYTSLLSRGLKHQTHGSCLAAALLLLVKGGRRPEALMDSVQDSLQDLGLKVCREQCVMSIMRSLWQLFGCLQRSQCIDHQMNMAAGITLASSEFSDAFLQSCDLNVLMEIVSTDVLTSSASCSSFHRRIYNEILLGHLPEICQHQLLQSEGHLQDFVQFCSKKNLPLHNLFSVTDAEHKEPLLYWSAFCSAPVFTVWCVSQMLACGTEPEAVSICLQRVVLVSVLSGDCPSSEKIRRIAVELSKLPTEPVSEQKMVLPFPKTVPQLTPKCDHLKRHGSYYLDLFLKDGIFPYDGVHVFINEVLGYFRLEMTEFHWRLVLRRIQAGHAFGLHDQDRDGNTFLHLAAKHRNTKAVKFALRSGASVTMKNNDGSSPADLAKGRLQNSQTTTASRELHTACQQGNLMQVKQLLCLDATVSCTDGNGTGITPLHSACGAGQITIASLLLELRSDINAKTADGLTPLSLTCIRGYHETADFLLQHHADANIADQAGWTPIHHATALNKRYIVALLLNNGARINAKSVDGHTPLHVACWGGNKRTVKQLLEENAKVNVKNKEGQTPLHIAAEKTSTDTIHLLFQCGADVNLKDKRGRTAIQTALILKNGAIYALLLKYKSEGGVVGPFAEASFPEEATSSAVSCQRKGREHFPPDEDARAAFDDAQSSNVSNGDEVHSGSSASAPTSDGVQFSGDASLPSQDVHASAESSVGDTSEMFAMESLTIRPHILVDRRAVIQEKRDANKYHKRQGRSYCNTLRCIKMAFMILLLLTMPLGCE